MCSHVLLENQVSHISNSPQLFKVTYAQKNIKMLHFPKNSSLNAIAFKLLSEVFASSSMEKHSMVVPLQRNLSRGIQLKLPETSSVTQ